MDSLTHIALGACIGEVMLTKKIGKRALLIGAVAQSLPDIDFLGSFFLPEAEDLVAHRGFTHSLLFAVLAGLLLSFIASRLSKRIPFREWVLFFILQLTVHDLLDTCNAYGTGLLEPFSHRRFSFNLLFVADPLFSIGLGIGALMLAITRKTNARRNRWVMVGIIPAIIYLNFTIFAKMAIDKKIESSLAARHLHYHDYFTTPTTFTSLLWYSVALTDSGYAIGYRSIFDKSTHLTSFTYFPANKKLLPVLTGKEESEYLVRFADRYYTMELWNDTTLVFNVLRFGQIFGWENPQAHFVFHYFLGRPADNAMVVQRGRMAGWNRQRIRAMLRRIAGKTD